MLRDLYLFHIKYTDVTGRVAWLTNLKASAPGNAQVERYCDGGIANIQQMRAAALGRERLTGWENFTDSTFDKRFLDTVKYDAAKIYQGTFSHQDKLLGNTL
jgi:hypothetical protein